MQHELIKIHFKPFKKNKIKIKSAGLSKTGKPGMTVQGSLLEQLKRESLALLGFLGCENVSQEMLEVTNGNLEVKMTQRTAEPRGGKK